MGDRYLLLGQWPDLNICQQHPLFWVNSYVFDYRSALRWRDTLHMWRYSIGEAMPTHEAALSPLRHAIANPDLKAGPGRATNSFLYLLTFY